jgi:sulfide dehydrogenase [flavocytochrome c] flavoprotein chain
MQRRQFLRALGLGATVASAAGNVLAASAAKAQVVVIGGGFGGATAAKYLRLWSAGTVEVTLIEPDPSFISCPLSNLVLGGSRQLSHLTLSYDTLVRRHGVRIIHDAAEAIDAERRQVRLAGGERLPYDRLIVSPGVDFIWEQVPGMLQDDAKQRVLHGWKAGPQTSALRRQLAAMPDGGTFVIAIPPAPFRCPPGPYERACQVAHYFSRAKKKSKVLILDGNDDVISKGALFKQIWAERYRDLIEYRPQFALADVDATTNTAISEFGDRVPASVLNLIPPQRAGRIAQQAGLVNINRRWCEVDFLTYESTQARHIHVLGDAIQGAPLMPKSGHMANQHAKVCAAAVLDLLAGHAPNPAPLLTNTCYSFVSDIDAIHVASVHAYSSEKKTMLTVPGSGGVSSTASTLEGDYAHSWARNIWADTLE